MTKHLTKPIRVIRFVVLAFLMEFRTDVSAEWSRYWIIGLDVLC